MPSSSKLYRTGLFSALVLCLGAIWMVVGRGRYDFTTFYHAWVSVIAGRADSLYSDPTSPNRFLYAPGFAWILSPLGWLSETWSFALWTLAQFALAFWIIRAFTTTLLRERPALAVAAAFGPILIARPFLFNVQYGTVNFFLLCACVWALFSRMDAKTQPGQAFAAWSVLAIAGWTKLFPGPLLLIPWILGPGANPKALKAERAGTLAGSALILLLPFLSLGVSKSLALYVAWKDALISRGMSWDSHNQSIAAFLYHYFSGLPSVVLGLGSPPERYGVSWLSMPTIQLLGGIWIAGSLGFLFAWLKLGRRWSSPLCWASVLIASLILPSHLIWKGYFVFGLPVMVLALGYSIQAWQERNDRKPLAAVAIAAGVMNFSGFDFIGRNLHAWLELGAVFLWVHLVFMVLAARWDRRSPA